MALSTLGTARGLRLAAALTAALVAAPLQAQLIDFTAGTGGFVSQDIIGSNPWTWTAGQGWSVSGATAAAGIRSRLFGLPMTSSNSNISVTITHRFSFEGGSAGCFDGGLIMQRVGGGAFGQINGGITGTNYTAPIQSGFGSPAVGAPAFCDLSAGFLTNSFITTTLSGTGVPLGTVVELAFDGVWDESLNAPNPNWQIASVEFTGFDASVVPEPSTYALMATGLLGLGGIVRRRRTS